MPSLGKLQKKNIKKATFALFIGILVFLGNFYYRCFVDVDAFKVTTIWALPGALPKSGADIPFFYTEGFFSVGSEELVPALEYRKGTRNQFIHSISWSDGKDSRIEVRGPKTPFKYQTADSLRICMTHMILATEEVADCIRFRTQVLAKELSETKQDTEAANLQIRWFEIENSALSEAETPRGVYINGYGPKNREDRYIFILPKGTLQTWVFKRTMDDPWLPRFEALMRGMRISEKLDANRAVIDAALLKTQLNNLQSIQKPIERISALTEIQTHLLSKISVSPGDIQAFLHLGGTARLLYEEAQKIGRYDLAARSRSLIEGALLYARGIDLKSDATFQLEKLALEVRGRSK